MTNFEAFRQTISSSINPLFLKSVRMYYFKTIHDQYIFGNSKHKDVIQVQLKNIVNWKLMTLFYRCDNCDTITFRVMSRYLFLYFELLFLENDIQQVDNLTSRKIFDLRLRKTEIFSLLIVDILSSQDRSSRTQCTQNLCGCECGCECGCG